MTPAEARAWLTGGTRVLDGATGSELLRRGVAAAGRMWGVGALVEDPGSVRALHREYAEAGAQALTAATFRVAPYALRGAGMEDRAGELALLAVRLAREGAAEAGRDALVFASQTTLEDCYRPDLVPADDTLSREHAATADILARARPDALLLETFNTAREARIAATAAATTGLPVIVSFVCRRGMLLSGEEPGDAAAAVCIPGVVAVGVNCTAVEDVLPALVRIAASTPLPLVAYANNAWHAADSPWLAAEPVPPEGFARTAGSWAAAGARLVGGCCGTGPDHIAAIAARLDSARR
ncbi:MAG TPA: homocysteine S-methyltransferase family protein [Thermoanaerobaculaceae bacterium]|nr:homocysteine S-methyltransferase family protein [Thermoanaerobaculaceae bacterium]